VAKVCAQRRAEYPGNLKLEQYRQFYSKNGVVTGSEHSTKWPILSSVKHWQQLPASFVPALRSYILHRKLQA